MPTRRLMTKNLYNARDLGGFPTRDGKTTRFSVFVRSEAPVGLGDEDLAYLKAYGVTASMDFRGTGEIHARPSDLAAQLPYHHKPLFNEAAMAGSAPKSRKFRKTPKMREWGEEYIDMAEEARDWAKEVLTIAAENPGVLLYHCTTGKDRTGLMTCYLLSIAGVDTADIVADYCVSQVFLEPVYEKMRSGKLQLGPPPPGQEGALKMDPQFFETPPRAMLTLISYLTETYGGVVPYLTKIGVPQEVMDKIRAKFLED